MRGARIQIFAHFAYMKKGMQIYDLKTEGMKSPLGIDTARPRFSWKIRGDNAVFQSWYRILVASDQALLMRGKADMWDSGKMLSDETLGIVYGGEPLSGFTCYYWKVEVNGVPSETGAFETAYLDKPMPHACWIGMPMAYHGATELIRLDFGIEKEVRKARLYLAALGCSRCYLNGEPVSDGYFDGAISEYRKRVFYRTYALNVRQGNNALCIETGYGFYGAKKICGELRVEYTDGTVSVIPTMAGRVWNVTRGNVSENSIYGGEVYDARGGRDKYSEKYPVSTSEFVAAYCVEPPQGALCANPVPPMRVMDTFAPQTVGKNEDGLIVDAGRNVSGWLKIRVQGERGAKITLRYAEILNEKGNISQSNLRTAKNRDIYILSGEKEEDYEPSFTYRGFRYVQISYEGKAEVLGVQVCHCYTALERAGTFRCSDEQLNALHEMAVLTESNNLNGVFTDCPQRDERLGWLNDMSSRIYEAVCNFDLSSFLPNFVNMITDSAQPSGAIGDTVPFSVGSVVADAVDAYQLLGWLSYCFYGDVKVLSDNYEGFCAWNRFLSSYKKDGIMSWGIYGDWCPAFPFARDADGTHSAMVSERFMAGAYYIWNIDLTRKIAAVLHREKDAEHWEKERSACKKAFFREYLDKRSGRIGNGSQTECAVAMTIFAEEDALCKGWAKTAAEDIAARGFHMTCGNQGYRHLFYRLAEAGYADTLVKLLKNREYPGWGFMLEHGATTVWERWERNAQTDMHSYDHPMFAGYDGFFCNYLAGIRTEECENAFSDIVLSPCFAQGIDWTEGSLETVRGKISVRWERCGERIRIYAEVPGNTTAMLKVPGKWLSDGEQIAKDVLKLKNGKIEITVDDFLSAERSGGSAADTLSAQYSDTETHR